MSANEVPVLLTFFVGFTGVLMSVIAWFITYTLKQININQEKLTQKVEELAIDLNALKAEHRILHSLGEVKNE